MTKEHQKQLQRLSKVKFGDVITADQFNLLVDAINWIIDQQERMNPEEID